MQITAEEAVARLKISRATLYAYVSRGLVRAEPDGKDPRRRLYRAEDVDRLVTRKARGRAPTQVAANTLDWGLPVLESGITLIDNGRLYYRGQDAAELAGEADLETVARLLWHCERVDPFTLAMPPAPAAWNAMANRLTALPAIDRAQALLPLMPEVGLATWRREARRLWWPAANLLRHVAAAVTLGAPNGLPIHRQLAEIWNVEDAAAETIRAALVLSADHELNASTFAVRVIASTGASLAACVAGGLAALSGPRHGGVTAQVEALFDEIE